IINEIESKHILTKSKLPGLGYCINPYVGCGHACVYCYARFMKRFTNHEEPWGTFVDVKVNAAALFEKDFQKVKPGEGAFFGSVTDCYQPLEARYKLTCAILQQIADHPERGFRASILTKSDLVLRDAGLLKRIPDASVGFSIALTNEKSRRLFEPRGSPITQRIAALRELHDEGISTYAFLGPILPGVTDLPAIFASLEGIIDSVYGETLNTHCGNMPEILRAVTTLDRRLRPDFDNHIRDRAYWDSVEEEFYILAEKHRMEVAGFFHHLETGTCS
ncbi:MAG: radical SAM protein, partial [Planctomycetaceae bacterium]|nr:radical SAM protein [Planctomycetaceae bacterium]